MDQPASAEPLPSLPAFVKRTNDRSQIETAYLRMHDALPVSYLKGVRGIPAALSYSSRFASRIKPTRRNPVFSYFDTERLRGSELKNTGVTSFARGGEEGLWPNQRPSQQRTGRSQPAGCTAARANGHVVRLTGWRQQTAMSQQGSPDIS